MFNVKKTIVWQLLEDIFQKRPTETEMYFIGLSKKLETDAKLRKLRRGIKKYEPNKIKTVKN